MIISKHRPSYSRIKWTDIYVVHLKQNITSIHIKKGKGKGFIYVPKQNNLTGGITTTRLRKFRLRHFVYRHFVYYDFPCCNRSWSDETKTMPIKAGLMQGILPN